MVASISKSKEAIILIKKNQDRYIKCNNKKEMSNNWIQKLRVLVEKNKKKTNKESQYMTDTMTPLMVGGQRVLIMKGRRENIVKLPSKIFLYVASIKQNHVSIIKKRSGQSRQILK